MAITLNTAIKNAILDGIDADFNAGALELRTGASPGAGSAATGTLLVSFTLGQAAYQTRGPIAGLELSQQIRADRIAGRGYAVPERLELPPSWDFDASFDFGIALVLNGVEATVRRKPAGADPSSGR